MPVCRFCDRSNPRGSTVCSECGAALTSEEQASPLDWNSGLNSAAAEFGSQAGADDLAGAEDQTGIDDEVRPPGPLDIEYERTQRENIQRLVQSGDLIAAIKSYRHLTGADLEQAHEFVAQLQAAGAETVPPDLPGLPLSGPQVDQILQLLRQGQKIAAIKAYRRATGQGLKEAKEQIDRLGRRPELLATPDGVDEQELLELLRNGQEMAAIRACRKSLGIDLQEAKEYVDELAARHDIPLHVGSRFGRWVLVCVLLLLIGAMFLLGVGFLVVQVLLS